MLKVDNDDIIKKIESILQEDHMKLLEKGLSQPMILKSFNLKIDKSENDPASDIVSSANALKTKIQQWK